MRISKVKIVFGLFISLAIASCSDEEFELTSPNDLIIDNLINESGVEALLIGAYDAYQKIPINENLLIELRSDNTTIANDIGSLTTINGYRLNVSNGDVAEYWANNFSTIAQTNLVIANESLVENKSIIGEALFLRALCHFNMVRAYENIPYIDRTIGPDEFNLFPQLPPAETYSKIAGDFSRAIELLSEKTENPRNRASEGAAKILLAKTYLSQPEPKNYSGAEALLQEFIPEGNASNYSLLSSFESVFDIDNELNDEIIFSIPYEASSAPAISSNPSFNNQIESNSEDFSFNMTAEGQGSGVNLASLEIKQLMTLGLQPLRHPVTFNELTFSLEPNDRTFNNKFKPDNGRRSGRDWIVLRYADVLLMHVEAIMAGGANTTSSAAISSFRAGRDRAGISDPIAEVTRQALLDERRVELAFENHRLFDLVRFGAAQDVLSGFAADNGFSFSGTDLLLPIPQREIGLSNGLLSQNPGY